MYITPKDYELLLHKMSIKELQEEVLEEMGIEVGLEELEWEADYYIADLVQEYKQALQSKGIKH